MDQNEDKNFEFKNKLIFFLKANRNKLLFLFSLIFILISFIIINGIYEDKKNNYISEKYIKASLMISSNENEKAKAILDEIILSENKFYSILALNILLEKNLEKDKNKILNYFEIIEKSNKIKIQKELIILKTALYLLKNSEIEKGEKILNELSKSDSNFKSLAEEILSK